MSGKRRGLVAPQNTFVESITRKTAALRMSFLLANARFADHPVVFVSNDFMTMTGYSKTEVLGKSCLCPFLHGQHTDSVVLQHMKEACDAHQLQQFELLFYKRNQSPLWLRINVVPVKDENCQVIMLLVAFKDTTNARQASESDDTKGLGKFARLARSISRNRSNMLDASLTSTLMKDTWATIINSPYPSQREEIPKVFENLRHYKQEPPKTPPFIILHYSTFKTTWDWFILLLTFYTALMVPANVAFHNKSLENVAIVIIDSFVDLIFFADIFFSFHTTIVGKSREVIADPRAIRANYVKTWFAIDLLSCLPYDMLYSMRTHGSTGSSVFNALKVLRLLRLGRIARKLDHYLEYGAAVLVLLVLVYIIIAHWMACIWYTLGISEVRDGINYGWLSILSRTIEQPLNVSRSDLEGAGDFPKFMSYVTALYFTLSCITSVGFGNVSANTEMEKIFTIVGMLLGSLLYATIFGNITTIFQQLYSATARYQEMLSNARKFMHLHDVPNDLANRFIDYIVSRWSMTKGVDTAAVLAYCPKDMKADICVHLSREVFNANPAFRMANEGCLRAIAIHLITNHIAPSDIIIRQGEIIDHFFFVVSGTLEVTRDDQIVALLHKGDVFGDPFWDNPSLGASAVTVKTLTYANVHHIKRERLREVLSFHTAFAKSFARNMVLSYDLSRKFDYHKIMDNKIQPAQISEQQSTRNVKSVRNLVGKIRRMSMNSERSDPVEYCRFVTGTLQQHEDKNCTPANFTAPNGKRPIPAMQLATLRETEKDERRRSNDSLIHLNEDTLYSDDEELFIKESHSSSTMESQLLVEQQLQENHLIFTDADVRRSSEPAVVKRENVPLAKCRQSSFEFSPSDELAGGAWKCNADVSEHLELHVTLKTLVMQVNDLNRSIRTHLDSLTQRMVSAEARMSSLYDLIKAQQPGELITAFYQTAENGQPGNHVALAGEKAELQNVQSITGHGNCGSDTTTSEIATHLAHQVGTYPFPKASFDLSSSSSLNLNVDRSSNLDANDSSFG